MIQPVLEDYGFSALDVADDPGVEPYLIATDRHRAEIRVVRRGDVSVGIEIPVDTEGRECDGSALR